MLDEIKKFIELQIHELSIVYIYSDEEYRIYNNVLYINPNSTDVIDIIKRNIPNAITKLSLHANFINTNLDIFDKLTNLSELTCNAGYLTIESWEHLKNNTNIRKINLNNCSITKDSVPSEINAIITRCAS